MHVAAENVKSSAIQKKIAGVYRLYTVQACHICSESHTYQECQVKSGDKFYFACRICKLNHLAGYRGCSFFIEAQNIMQIKTDENNIFCTCQKNAYLAQKNACLVVSCSLVIMILYRNTTAHVPNGVAVPALKWDINVIISIVIISVLTITLKISVLTISSKMWVIKF